MKSVLLLLLLTYASMACVGLLWSDRMIFLPPAATYGERDLPLTFVPLPDGGRIAMLHLPNPDSRFTLIFSHGNGEDLGHIAGFLAALAELGFSVLAYDYSGYGLSTGGPPGERATYRDIEAVYDYARTELGVPAGQILLHGRSVGTGPSLHLAATRPVGGVILESGFTSAFRVMTRITLLPFDRFPNLKRMRELDVPVLVIHGTRDRVIPFRMGRALYEAAPEPKASLWVEGAGHNDLAWVAGERYGRALQDFARLVASRGQASAG